MPTFNPLRVRTSLTRHLSHHCDPDGATHSQGTRNQNLPQINPQDLGEKHFWYSVWDSEVFCHGDFSKYNVNPSFLNNIPTAKEDNFFSKTLSNLQKGAWVNNWGNQHSLARISYAREKRASPRVFIVLHIQWNKGQFQNLWTSLQTQTFKHSKSFL